MMFAKIARVSNVLFGRDPAIKTGRELNHWAQRVGLSLNVSRRIVHFVKMLRHPIQTSRRRILARGLRSRGGSAALQVMDGYAKFSIDDIANGRAAMDRLLEIWRRRCALEPPDPRYDWAAKRHQQTTLRNCLLPDDLEKYPEISDIVLSDLFVNTATAYLGSVPILAGVEMWWNVSHQDVQGSQLYHVDQEDRHQIKFFLHLIDVKEANGPLRFFPASVSQRIRKTLGHTIGRLNEEDVYAASASGSEIIGLARAGDGIAVDTSQCIHMGSRTREGERLVLMVQYLPYNMHLESTALPPRVERSRYTDNALKALVLKN